MTIKEVYFLFVSELRTFYKDGEAIAITNIVFDHFSKLNSAAIVINGKEEISDEAFILL